MAVSRGFGISIFTLPTNTRFSSLATGTCSAPRNSTMGARRPMRIFTCFSVSAPILTERSDSMASSTMLLSTRQPVSDALTSLPSAFMTHAIGDVDRGVRTAVIVRHSPSLGHTARPIGGLLRSRSVPAAALNGDIVTASCRTVRPGGRRNLSPRKPPK